MRAPELRAASVRGQLRYWLRAYLGAQKSTLSDIWAAESAVFGSTGVGSAVSVRLYGDFRVASEPLLPHREGTGNNVSMAVAIQPEQAFSLQLVTRPAVALPQNAITALRLWSLLGGIGKRSRRMMGAVRITPKQPAAGWYDPLTTPQALADAIKESLAGCRDIGSRPPDFPVFQPSRSWVVVGTESLGSAKDANQDFFCKLLRAQPHFDPKAYGYAGGGGRRASPIHAQVRKIGNDFYPVFTAFWSEPLSPQYAAKISGLMKATTAHYSGITVWGGW